MGNSTAPAEKVRVAIVDSSKRPLEEFESDHAFWALGAGYRSTSLHNHGWYSLQDALELTRKGEVFESAQGDDGSGLNVYIHEHAPAWVREAFDSARGTYLRTRGAK